MLNKGRWIHRTRDSDNMDMTPPQQEHSEKCYTFRQIIFFQNGKTIKNAYKPLRPLGFMQIAIIHQMLHWCNILT